MKHIKIHDEAANGFYSIKEVGDFEYVNPIEKMIEVTRNISIINNKNLLSLMRENPILSSLFSGDQESMIERFLEKKALESWGTFVRDIYSQTLTESLFTILESDSKKEQIKIMKKASFTIDSLILFIFKAWEEYDFTFSQYLSRHNPADLDDSQMPSFSIKEANGEIKTIGKTTLSEGQIKSAIEQRHAVVAKFLDKGKIWHCFFQTYKSIQGQETGKYPHLHYISHTWGLSREQVLSQLQNKNYRLPSSMVHVDLILDKNHI